MPRPVNKRDWSYHADPLGVRPELAAHIGRVSHAWSMIEVLLGELLGTLLGRESRFTVAVYLNLRGARGAALTAVAEEALPPELLTEFRAIIKRCKSVGRSRNDVIHGMWAIDNSGEEALIWVDLSHHVRWAAAIMASSQGGRVSGKVQAWREAAFARHVGSALRYTEQDFINIEERISELFDLIFDFTEKVERRLRKRPRVNKTPKRSSPSRTRK